MYFDADLAWICAHIFLSRVTLPSARQIEGLLTVHAIDISQHASILIYPALLGGVRPITTGNTPLVPDDGGADLHNVPILK